MMTVSIAVTDDLDMHRTMLKNSLSELARSTKQFEFKVVGEYPEGQSLCKALPKADLYTLDIRMPTQDGLTTLLFLRRRHMIRAPICMASSEDEHNVSRFAAASVMPEAKTMTFEQKIALMAKVETRVLSGVTEAGKINSLLGGCEALQLDPRRYAQHLGANGFLHKPYRPEEVHRIIPAVLNGKSFTA
jgi:DNA-binding NarL/FixJ family response regulator